jgi:hypothetical protein
MHVYERHMTQFLAPFGNPRRPASEVDVDDVATPYLEEYTCPRRDLYASAPMYPNKCSGSNWEKTLFQIYPTTLKASPPAEGEMQPQRPTTT